MTRPAWTTRHRGGRAFSLVELLLAIGILGIGMISIAALFPAGISQQRQSIDDIMGPMVAENAISLLRSKLSADDFGTFEEFNGYAPRPTVEGDWGWLRPGVTFVDLTMTQYPTGAPLDDTGAYDIFSFHPANGNGVFGVDFASESPLPEPIYGIPWSRSKLGDSPPLVIVTQRERWYPQASDPMPYTSINETDARPQYVWDCAFRRYQGRIQVAIFVFRVAAPGGGSVAYTVVPNADSTGRFFPPIPVWLDLVAGSGPWPDDTPIVPNTDSGAAFDPLDQSQAWQAPRQWLLDQNGNIHRVLNGRRTELDGPVELVQRVPEVPAFFNGSINQWRSSIPVDYVAPTDGSPVSDLWYIPTTDANGLVLTPVFATVKEL